MGWLKWRNALNPSGKLNRIQFLLWLSVPAICIFSLVVNSWGLEKLFIRADFFIGYPGLNARLITQILLVALVLFLSYLIIIAMIKRYHDLNRPAWWVIFVLVPIAGVIHLVYLLTWAGFTSSKEVNRRGWLKTMALSIGAVAVFIISLVISLSFGLFVLFINGFLSLQEEPTLLRIWNQTDEMLTVEFIVSDGIVHQGYPADEIQPDEIFRNENILSREVEYKVTARNGSGKTVYLKTIDSDELVEINGTILIPKP